MNAIRILILVTVLMLVMASVANAQERSGSSVVVISNGRNVSTGAPAEPAPVQPTAVAGESYARIPTESGAVDPASMAAMLGTTMTPEQIRSLVRAVSANLSPETTACLVRSVAYGVETGLISRDIAAVRTADLQWLAQRCDVSVTELAPIVAEAMVGSLFAAAPTSRPPASAAPAPARSSPQSPQVALDEMRARTTAQHARDDAGTIPAVLIVASTLAAVAGVALGVLHLVRGSQPRRVRVRVIRPDPDRTRSAAGRRPAPTLRAAYLLATEPPEPLIRTSSGPADRGALPAPGWAHRRVA